MGYAMTHDGGGSASPVRRKGQMNQLLAEVGQLLDAAIRLDLGERDKAYEEAKRSGWCPNVEELMAQFDQRGREMRDAITAGKRELTAMARPFVDTADTSVDLAARGREWAALAQPFGPLRSTVESMYAGRGRWSGRAGASYWTKLPAQADLMTDMEAATRDYGDLIDVTAMYHDMITSFAYAGLLTLKGALTASNGLSGGGRNWFLRSAAACTALQHCRSDLNEASALTSNSGSYLRGDMIQLRSAMRPEGVPEVAGSGVQPGTATA